MYKTKIIHDNGKFMTEGYGCNKEIAERNASISGLEWLQKHKRDEITALLKSSLFNQRLKACFMQHENI